MKDNLEKLTKKKLIELLRAERSATLYRRLLDALRASDVKFKTYSSLERPDAHNQYVYLKTYTPNKKTRYETEILFVNGKLTEVNLFAAPKLTGYDDNENNRIAEHKTKTVTPISPITAC